MTRTVSDRRVFGKIASENNGIKSIDGRRRLVHWLPSVWEKELVITASRHYPVGMKDLRFKADERNRDEFSTAEVEPCVSFAR